MPFCVLGSMLAEEKDVVLCEVKKKEEVCLSVSYFVREAGSRSSGGLPLIVRFDEE